MASDGNDTSYIYTADTKSELLIFGPIYQFFKTIAAHGAEALVESASGSICFVMPAFRSPQEFVTWYKNDGKDHLSWSSEDDPKLQIGEALTVTPGVSDLPPPPDQAFADGIDHCLLTPILKWAVSAREAAKSKTAQKRYNTIVYRLNAYLVKYRDGVPQAAVFEIAKGIQVEICIINPISEETYIYAKPDKKALKKFVFENSGINHVDQLMVKRGVAPTCLSPEEMEQKVIELRQHVPRFHWQQTAQGEIYKLYTPSEVFVCETPFRALVREFEVSSGLSQLKISQRRTPDLFNFIVQGLHWCGFFPVREYEEAAASHELRCMDMISSYADPQSSPFYDGFPTKFTDLQPCTEIQGPGFYRVDNISWGWAHPKIEEVCKRVLGNIFVNHAVYPHPLLNLMEHYGVSFDIVEGAWAGGQVSSIDIRMPGERDGRGGTGFFMRSHPTKPSPRAYCLYVGMCGKTSDRRTTWIHGSDAFLSVCAQACEQNNIQATFMHFTGEQKGRVSYPSDDIVGLPQYSAFINAYECTKMITQLMQMDLDKVVNVKKDSITYIDHDCEMLAYFQEEAVRPFPAAVFESYLSCLPHEMDGPTLRLPAKYQPREQHPIESHIGCGGGGKTTAVLSNPVLQDVLVLNLSHKQCSDIQSKYGERGIRTEVYANVDTTDPDKTSYVDNTVAVMASDEVSQRTQEDQSRLYRRFPYMKMINIGDVGFQMPPIARSHKPFVYGSGHWDPLHVPPCGLKAAVRFVTPGTVHDPLCFTGVLYLECEVPFNVFSCLQGMSAQRFHSLKDFDGEKNDRKKFKAQLSRLRTFTGKRSFTCTESGRVRVLEPYTFAQDGFPGRLFSKGSQGLFRDLRANIFAGKMDLDQNAAMHRILLWLCKQDGVPCAALENYVHNRRAVLATIARQCRCSMSEAKERVSIAFTEGVVRVSRCAELTRIRREASQIRKALAGLAKHAWVLDYVPEDADNRLGKFISRLYQKYENLFTCRVMYALEERGLATHALLFDGLIIDPVCTQRQAEILRVAWEECEAVCPGVDMVWAFKPIGLGSIDFLSEPFDPIRYPCTEITPEYLRSWGPVFEYNENFRCKCELLRPILNRLRDMIRAGIRKEEMNMYIKHVFAEAGRIVSKEQLIEMYDLRKDTVVAARRSHVAEYTKLLSPATGANKFRVTKRGGGYNNGDYIVFEEPPKGVTCEPRHAQSTNEIQGSTLPEDERLFCDTREIFDHRHPYVNLSRAQYLFQLYLIKEWVDTYEMTGYLYIIRSPSTNRVYIGHTTFPLMRRLKEHLRCDKCTSRYVTRFGDAYIELLETMRFTLKADIEERESQLIMQYPTAVNAVLPQSAEPPIRPVLVQAVRAPKRKAAAKTIKEGEHKRQSKLPF